MGTHLARPAVLLLSILFLQGCGEAPPPQGTVSGIVEFKKQPSSELDLIILAPATGKAASTPITDGQFEIDQPMLTGSYVAYLAPRGNPNATGEVAVTMDTSIPDAYYNETTTPLKFEIEAGSNKVSFIVE